MAGFGVGERGGFVVVPMGRFEGVHSPTGYLKYSRVANYKLLDAPLHL